MFKSIIEGTLDPARDAMAGNLPLLWFIWVVACCSYASTAYGWQVPNDLAGLIADHLMAPAASIRDSSSTWHQQFLIHRELRDAGFHRTLMYSIQRRTDNAAHLQGCQTSLLQPLPSSIYADPYQLEDLMRSTSSSGSDGSLDTVTSTTARSSSFTFQLLGPLDLEL
jgi:hypothetical protein